jgi:hypothetical protein
MAARSIKLVVIGDGAVSAFVGFSEMEPVTSVSPHLWHSTSSS